MFDCNQLYHPFQNDPGTSQRQRVIDQLLSEDIRIDGRTLSDLLQYFYDLSGSIRFYDSSLAVSDWRPFFENSLPFALARISRHDHEGKKGKFDQYKLAFNRKPSSSGLQLLLYFIYYNGFSQIHKWNETLRDQQLEFGTTLRALIRNSLSVELKNFIILVNDCRKLFGIKPPDFSRFLDTAEQDDWQLQIQHLYSQTIISTQPGHCQLLKDYYDKLTLIWKTLTDAISKLSPDAEKDIQNSLLPAAEELKEKHSPHLALVFAFLRLFNQLQNELNRKTKEHLKYFYTEVLQIKSSEAEPDRVNIVFEIQKILKDQYQKHKIDQNTLLNGGRDGKNVDMLFATDEELILNETQIAEVKTLYLNNQEVLTALDKNGKPTTYLEGVYMAPAADKADGVEKDFRETDPQNWYTLGSKYSKYMAPGSHSLQQHPYARLGFLLAAPVLYLKEGKRTITLTIKCRLGNLSVSQSDYPAFHPSIPNPATPNPLHAEVQKFLMENPGNVNSKACSYVLISQVILSEAMKAGMSEASRDAIRDEYLKTGNTPCLNDPLYSEQSLVKSSDWDAFLALPAHATISAEVAVLPEWFTPLYPFRIRLSGEKEWISPSAIESIYISDPDVTGEHFSMVLKVVLNEDKPAVLPYNKDNFGVDLGISMPAIKMELEEMPGFRLPTNNKNPAKCCLRKENDSEFQLVSLYHHFRNVKVLSGTKIDVTVCGLKNFVVQNDESIMNVNDILLPFGPRPKISSNFYLSSPEIFNKNWSQLDVKFNWKDLPPNKDFGKYYHGYEDIVQPITQADLGTDRFVFRKGFLLDGTWYPNPTPNPVPIPLPPNNPFHLLFPLAPDPGNLCNDNPREYLYKFLRADFGLPVYQPKPNINFNLLPFTNDSRNNFLRLTLVNQDFQHSRYAYVLTRQMQALGKFPDVYFGPIYDNVVGNLPYQVKTIPFEELFQAIKDAYAVGKNLSDNDPNSRLNKIFDAIRDAYNNNNPWDVANESAAMKKTAMGNPQPNGGPVSFNPAIGQHPGKFTNTAEFPSAAVDKIMKILYEQILTQANAAVNDIQKIQVVIPNEPYTPQIQNILIDYAASSSLEEITLVHLHPYKDCYEVKDIQLEPTLFPFFIDQGNLHIGLTQFRPGINLTLLFQMAEATADSEKLPEEITWHYLANNQWMPLRKGFEVIEDGSLGLTTTGIVKLSLPENMTDKNTVMPSGLYWIKASIAKNSRVVSETVKVFTQAVSATFQVTNQNDLSRLQTPLEAGTIAKLLVADPLVKAVNQPFNGSGGAIAELDGGYYLRVSEQLRHKGRAIQKWDYERLALQEFPFVFRAKCINHSMHTDASFFRNDLPYAPGFVLLAVIPDLRIMNAGQSPEPKVPLSLLEKMEGYLRRRTSPFVRLKVVNPRYEKVNFCLTVTLKQGMDPSFYTDQLKSDLTELLAPWAVGKYQKLDFGQIIFRSDIIRFLENTSYVDFIQKIRMQHQDDSGIMADIEKVVPSSPRSILIAGNIEVEIKEKECLSWCNNPPDNRKPCRDTDLLENYCPPIIQINKIKGNG